MHKEVDFSGWKKLKESQQNDCNNLLLKHMVDKLHSKAEDRRDKEGRPLIVLLSWKITLTLIVEFLKMKAAFLPVIIAL